MPLPNGCSWSSYELYSPVIDGLVSPSPVVFAKLCPVLHQLCWSHENAWLSTKRFHKFEWQEWIRSIYRWMPFYMIENIWILSCYDGFSKELSSIHWLSTYNNLSYWMDLHIPHLVVPLMIVMTVMMTNLSMPNSRPFKNLEVPHLSNVVALL